MGRGRRPARGTLPIPGHALQFRIDHPLLVIGEQVVEAVVGHQLLPQRHRSVLLEHDLRVTAHGRHPGAELLHVADRGRQGGDSHRLRQLDDEFLPDRAALAIGEVVHLVEDDVAEPDQVRRRLVHHVAQNFRGHHNSARVAVDGHVPGEQTDVVLTVDLHQVPVLLVGQCLDGCGVEGLLAGGSRQMYGVLPHNRLAASGGCRHQDVPAGVQGLTGLDLEVIEGEVVLCAERHQMVADPGAAPGCRIPLRRRGHSVSLWAAQGLTNADSQGSGGRCGASPMRVWPERQDLEAGSTRRPETRWVGLVQLVDARRPLNLNQLPERQPTRGRWG